jgi:hypothetical protein
MQGRLWPIKGCHANDDDDDEYNTKQCGKRKKKDYFTVTISEVVLRLKSDKQY